MMTTFALEITRIEIITNSNDERATNANVNEINTN